MDARLPPRTTCRGAPRPSFSVGRDAPWREIVGVVGNTHVDGVAEEAPTIFWPMMQRDFWGEDLLIRRTMGAPAGQVRPDFSRRSATRSGRSTAYSITIMRATIASALCAALGVITSIRERRTPGQPRALDGELFHSPGRCGIPAVVWHHRPDDLDMTG